MNFYKPSQRERRAALRVCTNYRRLSKVDFFHNASPVFATRSAARRSRCERMKRFQKLQGDPGLGLDGPGGPEEP